VNRVEAVLLFIYERRDNAGLGYGGVYSGVPSWILPNDIIVVKNNLPDICDIRQ
jgi:hypothetical protein